MFLQLHRCFIMCSLKRFLLRYLMCSLKAIIASFFMCSQNIFAGVSKNILMRYLMCSLNIIWLVSIIISSKKSSGIVYSEVSVAGRFYHDQVSRLFIADSASQLFFKNFFTADYAGWPLFNHSFHLRSFKIDFLSSNYSKVYFATETELKWNWNGLSLWMQTTHHHLVEKYSVKN